MEIFPAIDLKCGRVVRLTQGNFDKVTVYSEDPVEMAKYFRDCGARNLHVVDLDGAKEGQLVNLDAIRKITKSGGLSIQVGGGIRDEERIKTYLEMGVARVILGTIALEDFDFTCEMIEKYREKIAVGVDATDDKVAVRGWLVKTDENSFDFCEKLSDVGLSTLIYTDISKDGAMSGTNLGAYERLSQLKSDVVASGGISSLDELKALKAMNIYGAILGKALYTKAIDLVEVMKIC